MRLARVAQAFDKMVCSDGYTLKPLFKAQLGLYDDTKRDSEAGERRVLSTGPQVVPPPRRVVAAAGTRYIMGHRNPDTFGGVVHRVGWVAHEATHLVKVRTLQQVCTGQVGLDAWAGNAWIKNVADSEHSSTLTPQFQFHFSPSEPIRPGHVLTYPDHLLVVRSTRVGPAGTLIALADEMAAGSLTSATITTGAWDPVTETWTGTNQVVTVLRARWQSLYEYRTDLAPKFGPGDVQLAFDGALGIKVGMPVTIDGEKWKITSTAVEDGAWLCRACRHA